MIDPDLMQGTSDRTRESASGPWVAVGPFHAVDAQHRAAICGAPAPYKWAEWPPESAPICPTCPTCLTALSPD